MTVRPRPGTSRAPRTATRPTNQQQPTRKSQPTKRAQDNMFEITFEDPTNGHTWTDVYYQTDLPQIKQHAKSTGVQLLRVRQLSAHHVFSTNLGGTPE